LKLWVPDTDPVKSMTNMAEDAQLSGRGAIHLRVPDTTIDQHSVDRLRTELAGIGEPGVTKKLDARLLVISIVRTRSVSE